MDDLNKLVLVIPVYNFADAITGTLNRLLSWSSSVEALVVHIVFSDDGSTDTTPSLIEQFIAEKQLSWELLISDQNHGKGRALRDGISRAYESDPDIIVFTDCDLHYGVDIITDAMLPRLQQADLVIADRTLGEQRQARSGLRRLASAVFNRLVALLTGITYKDTQAGLKGFRAHECRPLFEVLSLSGFAFDVELLSVAYQHRYRIDQLPITFAESTGSQSTSVIIVPSALNMTKDLLRINWNWKAGRYNSPQLEQRLQQSAYAIKDV